MLTVSFVAQLGWNSLPVYVCLPLFLVLVVQACLELKSILKKGGKKYFFTEKRVWSKLLSYLFPILQET